MGIKKALKILWSGKAQPLRDPYMYMSEPDGGAVIIPSADGYHYADDHPWSAADQSKLIDDLWEAVDLFKKGKLGAAPVWPPVDQRSAGQKPKKVETKTRVHKFKKGN